MEPVLCHPQKTVCLPNKALSPQSVNGHDSLEAQGKKGKEKKTRGVCCFSPEPPKGSPLSVRASPAKSRVFVTNDRSSMANTVTERHVSHASRPIVPAASAFLQRSRGLPGKVLVLHPSLGFLLHRKWTCLLWKMGNKMMEVRAGKHLGGT